MNNFEYANPATLKEALALLGNSFGDAAVLAGGTDLLSLMKEYLVEPKRLVNVKNLKELQGIAKSGGGLRIGAAVTIDELMENAAVRAEFPALVHAARGITSPQIRNMGTVGGDLCQRPRCWYFRNGFGLLGMKDGKSLVNDGENKYHAIFSSGPAKFVSASSLGPVLIALGAKVKIASPTGTREVEAGQFFVAPSTGDARETVVLPNEIVTEVNIPAARGAKNATYEVRQKDALDWPLVTATVVLGANARVVLGHVAPVPHHAAAASALLAGKTVTAALAEQAGNAAVEGAKPLSQNAYKVHLTKVAVKRAIMEAAGLKA
jgi:xanthine dehydrogenase YagS FAD-binding subunit